MNVGNIIRNKFNTITNELEGSLPSLGNLTDIGNAFNSTTSFLSDNVRVLEDQLSSFSGDFQSTVSQVQNQILGSSPLNLSGDVRDFLPSDLSISGAVSSLTNLAGNVASGPLNLLAGTVAPTFREFLSLTSGPLQNTSSRTGGPSQNTSSRTTGTIMSNRRGTGARLGNPLENYASYNPIFTIGCLSDDQVTSPSQYRQNGAAVTVLRSGGGGINSKRVQNYYEISSGRRVEYFIDDVEIRSILSPSRNTGVSTGHKIEFTVIEPYSMGQFLLSMQGAAAATGYRNYTDANFLLTIEFKGFDENSELPQGIDDTTKHIPFRLLNVEFNVESGGSVYTVEAMPINDFAFSDEVQRIPFETNFTGPSVAEALGVGTSSLVTAINQRQQDLENSTNIDRADLYLITFPLDRENKNDRPASSVGGSATVDTALLSAAEEFATRRGEEYRGALQGVLNDWFAGITQQATGVGYGIGEVDPSIARQLGITDNTITASVTQQANQLFDQLNLQGIQDINPIGRAQIIPDFNASGDNPFGRGDFTYNEETGVFARNGIELTISNTNRQFKFPQNMTIQEIIEEMVLISDYGRTALSLLDSDGKIPWFKVEAEVYPVSAPATEAVLGRKPRIFVYKVVPYMVSSDKFSVPDNPTPNSTNLANQSVKEYNYIYTGLNRDIISLDFEFKASFYDMLNAGLGNSNRGSSTNGSDNTSAVQEPPAVLNNPVGSATDGAKAFLGTGASIGAGGSYDSNVAEQIARQFHSTILDGVDLLQLDMEIWGDPYYIPDTGVGNYTAEAGPSITITADGGIDYQYNQVHAVVNFRTPIDYNESTGLMVFQEDELTQLQSYSGLYQILEIMHKFSSGKFTQELRMMRLRNQNIEGAENKSFVTQQGTGTQLGRNGEGTASEVGNSGPSSGSSESGAPASAQELNSSGGVGAPTPQAATSGEEGPTRTLRTPSGKTFTVAALYADNFQGLVDELEGDLGYEIRSIGGLSNRNIAGTGTLSWHSMGLAVDINPAQNPHNKPGPLVTDMPASGTGSLMNALASKYALGWGGAWNSSKDAMHFSAGRNERGTYAGPRDGRVPPGPGGT